MASRILIVRTEAETSECPRRAFECSTCDIVAKTAVRLTLESAGTTLLPHERRGFVERVTADVRAILQSEFPTTYLEDPSLGLDCSDRQVVAAELGILVADNNLKTLA